MKENPKYTLREFTRQNPGTIIDNLWEESIDPKVLQDLLIVTGKTSYQDVLELHNGESVEEIIATDNVDRQILKLERQLKDVDANYDYYDSSDATKRMKELEKRQIQRLIDVTRAVQYRIDSE